MFDISRRLKAVYDRVVKPATEDSRRTKLKASCVSLRQAFKQLHKDKQMKEQSTVPTWDIDDYVQPYIAGDAAEYISEQISRASTELSLTWVDQAFDGTNDVQDTSRVSSRWTDDVPSISSNTSSIARAWIAEREALKKKEAEKQAERAERARSYEEKRKISEVRHLKQLAQEQEDVKNALFAQVGISPTEEQKAQQLKDTVNTLLAGVSMFPTEDEKAPQLEKTKKTLLAGVDIFPTNVKAQQQEKAMVGLDGTEEKEKVRSLVSNRLKT